MQALISFAERAALPEYIPALKRRVLSWKTAPHWWEVRGEDASKRAGSPQSFDGYAILGGGGRLMSYVDGEDALGIESLCGEPGRAALTLDCGATAELAGGKVGLRPILDPDGRLAGLVAEVSVEALVMETTTQLDLSSDSAREELNPSWHSVPGPGYTIY